MHFCNLKGFSYRRTSIAKNNIFQGENKDNKFNLFKTNGQTITDDLFSHN